MQVGGGLSERHEKAIQTLDEKWNRRSLERDKRDKPKTLLYHYTSFDALISIFRENAFRFTDILYLNDPQEVALGLKLAFDMLDKYNEKYRRLDSFVKFFKSEEFMRMALVSHDMYVASFSLEPDDLRQWRMYADDGKGVQIGFNPDIFQPTDSGSRVGYVLCKVTYIEEDMRKEIGRLIEEVGELLQSEIVDGVEISESERIGLYYELSTRLYPQLLLAAVSAKHGSYSHERETRLVSIKPIVGQAEMSEFRTRQGNLVPFVSFDLGINQPGHIDTLTAGPASDEKATDALTKFTRRYDLPDIVVKRSKLSYRSFST